MRKDRVLSIRIRRSKDMETKFSVLHIHNTIGWIYVLLWQLSLMHVNLCMRANAIKSTLTLATWNRSWIRWKCRWPGCCFWRRNVLMSFSAPQRRLRQLFGWRHLTERGMSNTSELSQLQIEFSITRQSLRKHKLFVHKRSQPCSKTFFVLLTIWWVTNKTSTASLITRSMSRC